MIVAGVWGALAASFLLMGSLLAFAVWIPPRIVGLVLAFGAGTLFGAVAYELIAEAVRLSVTGVDVSLGFAAGAVVFFVGSVAIDRIGSDDRDPDERGARDASRRGLALVLGSVLDGLPESIVLGLSFVPGAGVGIPVLVAIAVSNVPEGLSATLDLVESGVPRRRIVRLWLLVTLASGFAAAFGYGVLGELGTSVVVSLDAFAAGAILAMLAESMIPEAYESGGRAVGLATCLGFAVAAYLPLST